MGKGDWVALWLEGRASRERKKGSMGEDGRGMALGKEGKGRGLLGWKSLASDARRAVGREKPLGLDQNGF